MANMINNFPTSIFLLRKYINSKEAFVRYVVCRECYSVYEYEKCVEEHGTALLSKKCAYRCHQTYRKSCNTLLLKTVHLKGGIQKLIPFKVYCYMPLQVSLQKLLLRPGFAELCEQWRQREMVNSLILRDIYDGTIWKQFQHIDGQPFLASPNVYAFMLNVDWFQPYKHTTSSVGAMYLTVMNLPYTVRYKRENTILLGILPGPSEPEKNINQFLRPFVKELQQYFHGIPMKLYGQENEQNVRCLLVGVTCDMPAGRKVCGFLAHSALLGCCKCLKVFPGGVGEKNYSGFDRTDWKPRTNSDHRSSVRLIQNARNITEQSKLESKYGTRYSVLLELSYFDPTRMLVVDPMHNLFLGTAKHMIKLWNSNDVLTSSNFAYIQKVVDGMKVPADIGRIPRKIETRFSGFTADQYKCWTLYYSIPSLHDVIDSSHLECWRRFVLASRLLCQKEISVADLNLADILFTQFGQRVERLYGDSAITPNMHMHCHLKEVVLDFGPVYTFWLFAYERYNGILQHQPSSNRSIEIEVMRRFIEDNDAYAFQSPVQFQDELSSVCSFRPSVTGTLLLMSRDQEASSSIRPVQLPTSYKYHVLTDFQLAHVKKLLSILLQTPADLISVNSICKSFKAVHLDHLKFTCQSIAMALWDYNLFGQYPTAVTAGTNPRDGDLRPFRIDYFAKASYSTNNKSCTRDFTFAIVSWFKSHPSRFELGKPVQVWCPDLFERDDIYSFIPLDDSYTISIKQSIHTHIKLSGSNESVLAVLPMIN